MTPYRSRWTNRLTALAMKALTKSPPDYDGLRELFGVVSNGKEEFIDCRGFSPKKMLMNVQLKGIDFSFGQFLVAGGGFGESTLDHCLFREIRLDLYLSSRFQGCDFSKANLRGAQCGPDCRFQTCIFAETDCSGVEFDSVHFANCLFEKSIFRNAEFAGCTFSKCVFIEPVFDDTFFGGCKMLSPTQNLKWYDRDHSQEKTHLAGKDANWLVFTGADVYDLSVRKTGKK